MASKKKNRQEKKFGESFHKKVTIAVNGYFQLYPFCGQGRYLREFIAWANNQPSINLKICFPLNTKNKVYQFIFEQIIFPLFCLVIRAEKAFVPYFAPPIWSPIPITITVHDLIHFRLPKLKWSTGLYKSLLLQNLKRVTHIITDSLWSKSDIVNKSGIDPKMIKVIPLGTNHKIFYPQREPVKNFFLWIGNDSSHKNKDIIFNLYRNNRITTPIVMIGLEKDPKIPHVLIKNNLSDNELALLYARTKALIVTSSFEGFGLPVIEALNCHCPIISNNIAPINSLKTNQISFFNNPGELLSVLNNPPKRTRLLKSSVHPLTWDNTFAATFAIING